MDAISIEVCGIGTTRRQRPVGAIPPTALEKRVKRSITIDPTVGSCSNVFHEFPEAVFDGVAWNQYNKLTVSGRGHSTDSDREPGQKVHNFRSDRCIAPKYFSQVSRCYFDRGVWNRYDSPTASGRGHSTDSAREQGQKVHNYRFDRWIALKCFSRVSRACFRWSCVESLRYADGVRSGPFHRQR